MLETVGAGTLDNGPQLLSATSRHALPCELKTYHVIVTRMNCVLRTLYRIVYFQVMS